MATRYTRKDADAAFARLCKAYDLRTGPAYIDGQANIGAHLLDTYHGYAVIQMHEHGGQSFPFGHHRFTAAEFVAAVGFAVDLKYQTEAR